MSKGKKVTKKVAKKVTKVAKVVEVVNPLDSKINTAYGMTRKQFTTWLDQLALYMIARTKPNYVGKLAGITVFFKFDTTVRWLTGADTFQDHRSPSGILGNKGLLWGFNPDEIKELLPANCTMVGNRGYYADSRATELVIPVVAGTPTGQKVTLYVP